MVGPFRVGCVPRTFTASALGWCISCTLLIAQEEADVKSQISNSKSQTNDSKSQVPNLKSEISNSKSDISNPEPQDATPDSELRNPKSEIPISQMGLSKLDKKSRAKTLSALAALVILGLGMVALAWLGARVTRRYMNPTPFDHERLKSSAPPADDWAKKPLVDTSDTDPS